MCANCHREIHDGLYETQELESLQVYDTEIANVLIQERDRILFGELRYCKNCGVQITRYSTTGYCAKCAIENSRVVKERPSREELKDLI